jgi:hypothetical protein
MLLIHQTGHPIETEAKAGQPLIHKDGRTKQKGEEGNVAQRRCDQGLLVSS